MAHPETNQEHQHKVEKQRDGDAHHVQRDLDDLVALQAEQHHDGEQQRDERQRTEPGNEPGLVPFPAFGSQQDEPGDKASDHGDPQVNKDALGDLSDPDLHYTALQTKQRRQHGDKEPGVGAVEQHLEDAVKGHQPSGVLPVAFGQLVPDDDHGDAPRPSAVASAIPTGTVLNSWPK